MWTMIASLEDIVEPLRPAFTAPSFVTCCQLLLGWIMCLGKHTRRRVAKNAQPDLPYDHTQRHGLDGYYNFLERSAWTPKALAYRVAVLVFTRLRFLSPITLLVDDTLAHKRGKSVWGRGWFRDACARP
jgi:DDE superfamily endonuclease